MFENFRGQARQLLARFRIPAQDADDLLQDTLLVFLNNGPDVDNAERWLQGALKNRCLVYWRERRRRFFKTMDSVLLEALTEPTPPCQEHQVFLEEVLDHLEGLSAPCSALLKLRYRSDYKPAQLADRLGYSRSGIYKILDRCVAALSRRLLVARRGHA